VLFVKPETSFPVQYINKHSLPTGPSCFSSDTLTRRTRADSNLRHKNPTQSYGIHTYRRYIREQKENTNIMATTAAAASVIPSLTERPIKNTICLFDVDGTLTPARRVSDN
jgi:hypothetical protein